MTRIFITGTTVLAVICLAACATDTDHQKKKHKFPADGSTITDEEPPSPPAPAPTPNPEPTPVQHTEVKITTPDTMKKGDVPYATPVAGKPGYVASPYAPYSGWVDVRGFPPGTEVKCPYTGKIFLVP